MTYYVMAMCYLFENEQGRHGMEPIVLMGLIVVVYGGYVALMDLWGDLSVCFPRQTARVIDRFCQRGRSLKSPIKKMAGVHV
jgi:hypothetical protein